MTIVKDEISNPIMPPWPNWLRRPPSKRKIVGSSPTGGIMLVITGKNASLTEWSKVVDLRPTLFGGAGSNPARCKFGETLGGVSIGGGLPILMSQTKRNAPMAQLVKAPCL